MARKSLKNLSRLLDTLTEELPPEEAFLSDLKRSIEITAEKTARKPSQAYKPSGMNCIRQSYYQLAGIEPDPAAANYCLVGITESGTDRHNRVQEAICHMRENGMDCDYVNVADWIAQREIPDIKIISQEGYETKLYNTALNISFLCDGIIKYKNHYYILELKTETVYKWQNRRGVDPSHYQQAITYSLCLHLDQVVFVYINRDVCDMKAYMFTVTDEMRMAVVGYIANCDSYVALKQVPPIPEDVPKKACEYCMYRGRCKADG